MRIALQNGTVQIIAVDNRPANPGSRKRYGVDEFPIQRVTLKSILLARSNYKCWVVLIPVINTNAMRIQQVFFFITSASKMTDIFSLIIIVNNKIFPISI